MEALCDCLIQQHQTLTFLFIAQQSVRFYFIKQICTTNLLEKNLEAYTAHAVFLYHMQ